MVYCYFGDKGKKKSEKLFNSIHFFYLFLFFSLSLHAWNRLINISNSSLS